MWYSLESNSEEAEQPKKTRVEAETIEVLSEGSADEGEISSSAKCEEDKYESVSSDEGGLVKNEARDSSPPTSHRSSPSESKESSKSSKHSSGRLFGSQHFDPIAFSRFK
jgi:hypothetical protein